MKRQTEWCQTFFDDLYARVLGSEGLEASAPRQARVIKRMLRLRRGQRVLDLACGMGRISVPLAQLGLEVTGVDLAGPYLRRARRRAQQAGVKAKFVHQDMRQIDFRRQFDGVISWFTSFGYFSDEENLEVLRRMWQALRPGGRMLIDIANKSWLLANWISTSTDHVNGVTIRRRGSFNTCTSRTRDVWIFSRGKTVRRQEFSLRLYDGSELRALLEQAGFVDIELHPNPPGKRFTRHSKRLIALARRPAD